MFVHSPLSVLAGFAMVTAAAFAIDSRTAWGMFGHYVVYAPACLLMAFLTWQGRRAEARMLTRSVVVEQRLAVRRDRDTLLSWLAFALAVGGGIAAGWLTQSVTVLFVVSGGVAVAFGVCSWLASWLRRATGVAA